MPVDKLTKNQKKVLAFLKRNAHITYQGIADGTSLPKGSVQRIVLALQNKGLLTRQRPLWVVME